MSKKRGGSLQSKANKRVSATISLEGVTAVNALLDPKLDLGGLPPVVALEQVGRKSLISAAGVLILSSEKLEVVWVRAVVQRVNQAISKSLTKKLPEALLIPNPSDPRQLAYQFIDDSQNTQVDCRIRGARLGLDNRLVVYAKIRHRGLAKQFLAQTCLQFQGLDLRGSGIAPVAPLREHTVSVPRPKMGGLLQKYRQAGQKLDACYGTATLPTAGIKEVAAYIYQDETSANAAIDPPNGAIKIVFKSLQSEYKFKQDYYDGVLQDYRIPGVNLGPGNFLVVWAKFDGSENWVKAQDPQKSRQFEGIY
jgi:hypothetical protein